MPSPLQPLFTRILRASLATPLVLTGCGVVDATDYVLPACDNNRPAVGGLSPATPPDLVQLRSTSGPNSDATATVVSSAGTACATATQPAACLTALDKLKSSQGFRQFYGEFYSSYYLATTRGDEVAAHTSLEALRRFLGTIDTASEAVLLAFAEGLNVSCTELKSGGVKSNPDGTFQVLGTAGSTCGEGGLYQVVKKVSPSGDLQEVQRTLLQRGDPNCAIGRRPDGLHAAADVACDSALGRHFAQAAHLEAASIQAFLRLHEELARHGADAALRDAALASALDEVVHTDVSTRLAHRFGAIPPRLQVEPRPPQSLFELARENSREGCTRETYGALVAHYQALHARDAEVREAMVRIAEDETRHAELSWAIDHWARARLSETERAALLRARREAVETLRQELVSPPDAELVTQAGMPPPEVAQALLASLEQELWLS